MTNSPKVLVVEDEAIIARDIRMQLTNSGFDVTGTARSAMEAFEKIEQVTPDLVLMDIRIKGEMDGVEAAHVVRDRYALPVIYLTAHADDNTLERAQQTEPFGYIVKPLGNTNIKAIATMALHKHRMERELESSRKMLSTILQGLPDAIIVADVSGEVLFLNQAAEQLTGWSGPEAAGRNLLEIVSLEDGSGRVISGELLEKAIAENGIVRIPRDSGLTTRDRGTIDVSGQLSVTAVGNRAAGVFVTLQDVTVQKREEQRLAQEQQLFVAGELAQGVAHEFWGLFDLIDDCAADMQERGMEPDAGLVRRASQIGKGMSLHLMDFRESHGEAHAINVNQYLLGSEALLQRFCGRSLEVEISSVPDAGYVLCTGNHFEQILMHLALNSKHRAGSQGKVMITADVQEQAVSASRSRSYVRLMAWSQRQGGQEVIANDGGPALSESEHPDLSLPIVRAIATASGGFTRVSEPSNSVAMMEVFLPRQESRIAATAITNEYQRVVLVVGLGSRLLEAAQRAAGGEALLLEAATLGEASLIAELYPGEIDLVVINDRDALPKTSGRACDRIRARRPGISFLQMSSLNGMSAGDSINPAELAWHIESFFDRKLVRATSSSR